MTTYDKNSRYILAEMMIDGGMEFKPIPGYEGLKISKCGLLLDTRKESAFIHIAKKAKHNDYEEFQFYVNNKRVWRLVHRLVALAWIPNPNPSILINVNHKDGNKLNNHADNLEWVTQKENINHAWANGLMKREKNRLSTEIVLKIREVDLSKTSIYKTAKKFGIDRITVRRIINGESYKNV